MYKCKLPEAVYNPFTALPTFGENDIETTCIEDKLVLKILYDNKKTGQEDNLKIEFDHPVFYKVVTFPGVDGMNIEYEYGDNLSSLIEFKYSEFKMGWEKHFNGLYKFYHHKILFSNTNKSVEVVSEGFRVI